MAPEPHPAIAPLAGLLGTWQGRGTGHYPTIADFAYVEEVVFTHVGKPFVAYRQRTRRLVDGEPGEGLHAETGYLRPAPDDGVELVVAQPTGIVEVYTGRFVDGVADLEAIVVGVAPTAKRVSSLRRRFALDGDSLAYDLWMAYADVPRTHHLSARLARVHT